MVLDPLCLRPNMLLRWEDQTGDIWQQVYLKALAAGIEDASERAPTEVVRW